MSNYQRKIEKDIMRNKSNILLSPKNKLANIYKKNLKLTKLKVILKLMTLYNLNKKKKKKKKRIPLEETLYKINFEF